MFNTIPEILRKHSVESAIQTETMTRCWVTWQPEILRHLGHNFNETNILNLGNRLSEIFITTAVAGRGQGDLAGGGTAWESLVCWYLNLCLVGSRSVALKKKSLVPRPIRDGQTVNYTNFSCNTESDITVITFPNIAEYSSDITQLNITDSQGVVIPVLRRNVLNMQLLDHLVNRDFARFEVGVVQCKTNWNDNAQIPMLWDMIYSAGGFRRANLSIGKNGFSIQNIPFSYSFVTVPTNRNVVYDRNSVAVKRVASLSGGNYWGRNTQQGIARSLSEIFTTNFTSGARTNIRTDLHNALPHFTTGNALSYFGI